MTAALRPFDRAFYQRGAVSLAEALLGKMLVHVVDSTATAGIIVETEAYAGREDAACHSFMRKGPDGNHRTNVMFGPGGFAYVYLIYGMYNCFNVVASEPDRPEAVLIRALEPRLGIGVMRERRRIKEIEKLCSGPGKLCMAMGITREHYGMDLCGAGLYIAEGETISPERMLTTPRINVDYAEEAAEYPYRFVVRDSRFLSTRKYVKKD